MKEEVSMDNQFWDEEENYDDEELNRPDKKGKGRSAVRKRKWREIESIKEQRRLRRDLASFEHYSF